MMKLLICLPAYNEALTIGAVLDDVIKISNIMDFDILVVDDCSEDATREICKDKNVMVITHIYNLGYGAALKTAYKYAMDNNYDYIIQMDADGQHDASNIQQIYKHLVDNEHNTDIVIGSRFLQGSVSFYIPFYKKLVIKSFNWFIRIMTKKKITDPTSGLQGLNREAFTYYSGFEQFAMDYPDANMIIQMMFNDFVVKEIPAVMHPRKNGVSMHSGLFKPFKYIFIMMLSVFIIYMRESLALRKRKNLQKSLLYTGRKNNVKNI